MTANSALDADVLREARTGSHQAFRELVEPYRAELQRHCYRMTGSVDDADDLVQETLLRAWRRLETYVSNGSFRAWLYRIATNRTLDLLKSAPRRREVVNTAGEPFWLQPYPTGGPDDPADTVVELETVGIAFVVALQSLPGRQRAALLLCDVLGFAPGEAAETLATTLAATNSLLQRARATIARAQPTLAAVPASDRDQQKLVERFTEAWRNGDTDSLVALLNETSHLTMPPHEIEVSGARAIAELLLNEETFADHRLVDFVPITASGEHGIATYVRDPATGLSQRHCIMLFGGAHDTAKKITGFTDDRIFNHLDLPPTFQPTAGSVSDR